MRKDGNLRIDRTVQLFLAALKAQLGNIQARNRRRAVKDLFGDGAALIQCLAHLRMLRALARKMQIRIP